MTDSPTPPPEPQPPTLRASDADRERVATLLQKHFADGRLNYDELQERLERTYASRTVGELDKVLEDLPVEVAPKRPSAAERPPATSRKATRSYEYIFSYLIFMLFLIAIWAISGRHGSFWPIWPIIVFGAIVARRVVRDLGR
jgi:hypothetical protein